MNMINRKLKIAPIDGDDVLAVLDRRLLKLETRRAVVTKLIIAIEKTTGASKDDASADLAQAEALLDDDGAKFVASRDRPMSQLDALHAERDVIDRALKIGRDRQYRLTTKRSGEIWAAHFTEIATIEKRRVFLAIELQKINRNREVLREKITAAGGAGFLSTDGGRFLEFGDVHDEVQWAANRLIADGIATKAEIEKARKDV
jgi:hypothetical protein